MANRERGEFRLVAGDKSYLLKMTTNGLAEVEDLTGKQFDDIVGKGIRKGSVKSLRILLWVLLLEHHPEIANHEAGSLREVGRVIDAAGGVDGLWTQLKDFLAANAEPQTEPDGAARPPDAPADSTDGTGAASTSTPASPA